MPSVRAGNIAISGTASPSVSVIVTVVPAQGVCVTWGWEEDIIMILQLLYRPTRDPPWHKYIGTWIHAAQYVQSKAKNLVLDPVLPEIAPGSCDAPMHHTTIQKVIRSIIRYCERRIYIDPGTVRLGNAMHIQAAE